MKTKLILSVLIGILLSGCDQESVSRSNPRHDLAAKSTYIERIPAKPMSIVEQKNAQYWDDGRIYITEHNYIRYQDGSSQPTYYIYKAKEWPKEDINNHSSYDLPRVVFRWDNGARDDSPEDDRYERKDKVWSIKTDGTDLRLVADEFYGRIQSIKMSPNNRYLALSYGAEEGVLKVIKDLKTGEYTELGKYRETTDFLWAEDSSYLYFSDQWKKWKYTVPTKKLEKVDVNFSKASIIYDGKRYVVDSLGVGIYDEKRNKLISSVIPNKDGDIESRIFRKRTISPTGQYVWVETWTKRYLIDTYNQTFKTEDIIENKTGKYSHFDMIGLGANYVKLGSGTTVVFKLNDKKEYDGSFLKWSQVGTGHSASEGLLYNAFANRGDFFKSVEVLK
ncbi:Tricorn protease domain-containing protein [Photobacterium sp. R1]